MNYIFSANQAVLSRNREGGFFVFQGVILETLERINISLDNFLIKSGNTAGTDRVVFIEASNEARDLQNEIILQKALKDSVDYFLSEGLLSYDHLHKANNYDPDFVLGEPDEVKFANDEHKTTFVKGHFYNDNDSNSLIRKVYDKIQQGSRRVRASVGGGIIEKVNGLIKAVKWDEVAFSFKPVNNTLKSASIIPIGEFAKSFYTTEKVIETEWTLEDVIKSIGQDKITLLIKALQTGSQTDSAKITGGQALIKQSIYSKKHSEQKDLFKDLFNKVILGKFKTEKSLNDYIDENGLTEIKPALYQFILKNKGGFKQK